MSQPCWDPAPHCPRVSPGNGTALGCACSSTQQAGRAQGEGWMRPHSRDQRQPPPSILLFASPLQSSRMSPSWTFPAVPLSAGASCSHGEVAPALPAQELPGPTGMKLPRPSPHGKQRHRPGMNPEELCLDAGGAGLWGPGENRVVWALLEPGSAQDLNTQTW